MSLSEHPLIYGKECVDKYLFSFLSLGYVSSSNFIFLRTQLKKWNLNKNVSYLLIMMNTVL